MSHITSEQRTRGPNGQTPSVHLAFGFHINTSHSYRIDSNDERGFAKDLVMIERIVDALDAANERGVPAGGVWDTEQMFAVEECLFRNDVEGGSELLARIQRRVRSGRDEVIHMSYNNGLAGAMTKEELDAAISRSKHNDRGSGIVDLFGCDSRIVRPQEMMFSSGAPEVYHQHGIDTICLYYSATSFGTFRPFVRPLSAMEAHNPLRLERAGEPAMRVIPTYHTTDLIEHVSLRHWVRELQKRQKSGEIDGDVLLFVNFDADHESWGGFDLPAPLRVLPNSTGLAGLISSVEKLDFVRFTSLQSYLDTHPDCGTISFEQDTADGAWNGYGSWSEKYSSHLIFRAVRDDRRVQRYVERLKESMPEAARTESDAVQREAFDQRLRLLSTTCYGLATPFVAPGREAACAAVIRKLNTCHDQLRDMLAAAAGSAPLEGDSHRGISVLDPSGTVLGRFVPVPASKAAGSSGGQAEVLLVPSGVSEQLASNTLRIDRDGQRPQTRFAGHAPGGELRLLLLDSGERQSHEDQSHAEQSHAEQSYAEMSHEEPSHEEKSHETEGLSLIERDDGLALEFQGHTVVAGGSFVPTINFDGRTITGEDLRITRDESGSAVQMAGSLRLPEASRHGQFSYRFTEVTVGRSPIVFVDGRITFPETPPDIRVHPGVEGLDRAWDSRWVEVEPFPIRFARPEYEHARPEESGAVVSRENALGRVGGYAVDYHRRDSRNWHIPSMNNHITEPWCALSVNNLGLAVGIDERSVASFAPVPIRAVDPSRRSLPAEAAKAGDFRQGRQERQEWTNRGGRVRTFDLNPLGTYYGPQWTAESWGRGVGIRVMEEAAEHLASSAPTFNGRTLEVSVVLAPFAGSIPPEEVRDTLRTACRPAELILTEAGRAAGLSDTTAREEPKELEAQRRSEGVRLKTQKGGDMPISAAAIARIVRDSLLRPSLRFPGNRRSKRT